MDRRKRRLAIFVAALLVVLFVGRTVLSSLHDDGPDRRAVSSSRSRLSQGGEAGSRPDPQDMRASAALRDALAEERDALLPRLRYVQDPAFTWTAGTSPDIHYIEVLRREQELLVQRARFVGKSVPSDLGMPVPNPTGLEEVLAALRSMHVVHRVVEAALEADVAAVDAIRVQPRSRRPGLRSGFLREDGVEFTLRGTPRAVRDTLAAIVGGTPYLALDEVRMAAQDEDGAQLRCDFVANALTIDTEQTVLED